MGLEGGGDPVGVGFNYGKQNVLEGFSFAMIIGVLVGTYSSVFVASPTMLLVWDRWPPDDAATASTATAAQPATP